MLLSVGHCFLFMILTIYFVFTYLTADESFLTYLSEVFWSSNILITIFVSTVFGELAKQEVWIFHHSQKFKIQMLFSRHTKPALMFITFWTEPAAKKFAGSWCISRNSFYIVSPSFLVVCSRLMQSLRSR